MRYLPLLLLTLLLAAPAATAREPRPAEVFAEFAQSKKKRAAKKVPADPVVATITGCGGNQLTVVVGPASGRAGRPARRAKIFASVEAVALFGAAVKKPARDLGKTGTEAFSSLGSNAYVGIVRWSLKRGSRTIDRGLARTGTLKVAGKRGAGICTLPEGHRAA
ncbi:MAG: hypothetical protein H0V29_07930 [Thermoleophilaceae bacterium]|nr:hypothetical protein [Thermoleophilaceae bacterium]